MTTLILSRRHSDDSNAMWRGAIELGWDVERLQSYAPPEELRSRDPVFYGEPIMADAVSEALGLTFLEPTHDWLPELPFEHVKRRIRLASLGDVRAVQERAFIKPVDEKIFPARVYDPGASIDSGRAFPDDSPVLISEPISFGVEVRAFIAERRVRALSAYMRDGDLARDADGSWSMTPTEHDGARSLLEALLNDERVELPPAVVVDVGSSSVGWVVVEANPCWASGICGCDPRDVLHVIRRASVRTSELGSVDERWARGRA